jgi:hypothetical protein
MSQGFAPNEETAKAGQTKQALCAATDAASIQQQWELQFAELEDPRGSQGVEHPFLSIVMIAILAVIGEQRVGRTSKPMPRAMKSG